VENIKQPVKNMEAVYRRTEYNLQVAAYPTAKLAFYQAAS
jgi:hypothetical protein